MLAPTTDPTLDLTRLAPVLERFAGGGRTQLLPALLAAQKIYGYLPEPVAAAIGQALEVPLAEVHGVIGFYTMLYTAPTGREIIRICTSPRCVQLGGHQVLQAVCDYLGVAPGETTPDGAYMVEAVPCLCLCDSAPAGLVDETPVGHLTPDNPAGWLHQPQPLPLGIVGGEPRWLSARCGQMAPTDLDEFQAQHGFQALRQALSSMTPAGVTEAVKASGLVGRGGAAFPTGLKWELAANTPAGPRYVVCNADESEPGTFKDRVLMEGDPFAILEGMALTGYAIGAAYGYIYIRGEYPRAQAVVQEAIDRARAAGFLGDHILGSNFSFDVVLRSGAGAYICGEETALFESIEGKRGFPRLKPPFPTTHGLFNRPTVINNVETLCAVPEIVRRGPAAYRAIGTAASPGPKLFCLSGDVARPGVYEAPFGIRLGDLITMAGGPVGDIQAILLGGAAGAFAGPEQLDLPMSFEGLRAAGLPLGSGVVMVINQNHDLRQTLLSLAEFFAHESCGKCYPCQLGTQRQLEIMRRVASGRVTAGEVTALADVGFTMTNASLCGLGATAGMAILSALDRWPALFEAAEAL